MYLMSIKNYKELLIGVRNDLFLTGYEMSPADTDFTELRMLSTEKDEAPWSVPGVHSKTKSRREKAQGKRTEHSGGQRSFCNFPRRHTQLFP